MKEFFLLIYRNSGMNLYDFCLQLVEFVLSNKNHCQYLIYSPNSSHFLNIFQKVYITVDEWENQIPLESLLFLSEIICKSIDNYNGYEIVVKRVISKIANFNVRLLKDELSNDKIKTRICFALLRFYKDIEDSKIDAVDSIEKAKALLTKLNQLDAHEAIPIEEIERQSIVLPWVSFEECITKETLDIFSKDLDLEVNILQTRTKFDLLKKEIKDKEEKKEKISPELQDKMLTLGLFFFSSIFEMFDDESTQQKDKNLLLECLRCGRKAISKASFKGFFMIFRYLYIKQDLLRIKGQKINTTLFSALFERSYLTNIIKDSFDRCKKLFKISNDFFIEGCLSQTIFDYVHEENINKRIIRELNEGIFGGNECTENVFMGNIDEHIKEIILIFKKMMCLMANFINPQNITYICTLSTSDSFNSVLGFLLRLQSCIAIILCWYHSRQSNDVEKALVGYKDLFMLIQYIDFACNQSGELLKSPFIKFIDQYFDNILWMSIYFKRNYPDVYQNIDIIINRSVQQVYSIDFSIEDEESESVQSQKVPAQRGRKPKSQKKSNEEDDEINEEMASFDMVPMIKSTGKRDPDIFEIAFLIDLMLNNPNYQGLKSSQIVNVLSSFNKSPALKDFWFKTRKSMIKIKGKLDQSYFQAPAHLCIKSHIKNCLTKGIIKAIPLELQNPIANCKICFCKNQTDNSNLTPNSSQNCWEKDFFVIANSAIFTEANICNFLSFPKFPYLNSIESKEEGKGSDIVDDREISIRRDLLEFDLFFNPTSYQSCIMYGYLASYNFQRFGEGIFCKGQKTLQKEVNDFDISLNSFSYAIYLLVSKLSHKYEISSEYLSDNYSIELISKEWCEREEGLERWKEMNPLYSVFTIFFILFKTINLNYVLSNKKFGDMQANIVLNKLKNLASVNSICLLNSLQILNAKEVNKESVTILIESMCLFLKLLHNDKWVRIYYFIK